eukprot:9223091-Alexandrium_andersonii.AAC.1
MLHTGMNAKYSKGKTSRCHHHFVSSIHPKVADGEEQEGVRKNSVVAVFVDLKLLHDDGAYIYLSANGVFLTAGFGGHTPLKYIMRAKRIKDEAILYPHGPNTIDPWS